MNAKKAKLLRKIAGNNDVKYRIIKRNFKKFNRLLKEKLIDELTRFGL